MLEESPASHCSSLPAHGESHLGSSSCSNSTNLCAGSSVPAPCLQDCPPEEAAPTQTRTHNILSPAGTFRYSGLALGSTRFQRNFTPNRSSPGSASQPEAVTQHQRTSQSPQTWQTEHFHTPGSDWPQPGTHWGTSSFP